MPSHTSPRTLLPPSMPWPSRLSFHLPWLIPPFIFLYPCNPHVCDLILCRQGGGENTSTIASPSPQRPCAQPAEAPWRLGAARLALARARLLRASLATLRRGVQFPRALQTALAMARQARGETLPPAASPVRGALDAQAWGDGYGVGDEALDNGAWTTEQDSILASSLPQLEGGLEGEPGSGWGGRVVAVRSIRS